MAKTPTAPETPETQQAPTGPTFQYVDIPNLSETFADSIHRVSFDGQSLRLDFSVTRMEESTPGQLTRKRYPACRLALSLAAAVELINQVQKIAASLTQAGVLKQTPTPSTVQESK
jgi:hypothetical protein